LKSSPISAASPRVQPGSGRRQSLAETKRSHTTEIDYPRKSSTSAYSTNSRKNSLADESNTIAAPTNQQGKIDHRFSITCCLPPLYSFIRPQPSYSESFGEIRSDGSRACD
jgi:hypothetical protein